MKKIKSFKKCPFTSVLMTLFLLTVICTAVFAASFNAAPTVYAASTMHPPAVSDNADLLTADEEAQLEELLEHIRDTYAFDAAAATVSTTNGISMETFTDAFYDDHFYGIGENYDGILFLISIGDRQWHITTHGYGMTVFDDTTLSILSENITAYLQNQDFFGAFEIFAEDCETYLEQAASESAFASDSAISFNPASHSAFMPLDPVWIPISVVIGFLIALACTLAMKAQLKSVRSRESASDYVRPGSMQLTRSNDIFLYHTVTRKKRPEPDSNSCGRGGSHHVHSGGHGGGHSSGHHASGGHGGSHGGTGGRF